MAHVIDLAKRGYRLGAKETPKLLLHRLTDSFHVIAATLHSVIAATSQHGAFNCNALASHVIISEYYH